MTEPRFLVVRLGSLGDIVHTFPAVSALRQSFPSSNIIWLTHPRWKELVNAAGLADEIWEIETRSMSSVAATVRRIRGGKFSTAIDYQGLWKSAAIPFLARVPRRIGFASGSVREFGVPILYSDRVEATAKHVADKNGALSLKAGAVRPTEGVRFAVPQGAKAKVSSLLRDNATGKYAVLSPGGGWVSKCWPAERYGELARRLFEELGLRSLINFGPGEEGLASKVISTAGTAAAFPCSGNFDEFMAVLQGAECMVGGDTGPLHLADALGTRVVAIFGPTDPARNGPYWGMRSPGRAAVLRAEDVQSTYKREDAAHPSLLKIGVEEVFAAIRNLLGNA
ncbi:MAG: lipopolysaccharide heptosyltransferase I [Candidatus Acidiferrum sp.]